MGCEKCNPIIMTREGCCTGETGRAEGFGSKIVKDRSGNKYDICGALGKDDDGWYCEVYSDRPEVCRGFDCDRSILSRIRG